MQYQTLTATAYVDLLVRLISGFEGHEIVVRNTGDGKATIGYGYTFNRSDNVAIWTAAGIILTRAELTALAAIDATSTLDKTTLTLSTFTRSLSRTEAQALLKQTYPKYEQPATALGMPLSAERAAFVSLTYNRGETRVNGMTEFAAALNGSDRAEAWYQLRYNALGTTTTIFRAGVAKRRFVEAEIFRLYDNQASSTESEARQAFAMLTNHRGSILAYEATYGIPPDGSTATRNMIAEALLDANLASIVQPQSLFDALIPARDTFITWLNTQLPVERQIDASILNPAAIYYNGNTTPGVIGRLDASSDDGKGTALEHNVMVGNGGADILIGGAGDDVLVGQAGSDVLEGGAGVDELFGGADNDILNGGTGDDILYGGAGEDLYIWNTGDGNDTIVDDDGGRLIVNGVGYGFGGGTMTKVEGQNVWEDPTGNVKLTHNSPWRIELSDGSVIQLGEGFDPAKWHINLVEEGALKIYTGEQRAKLIGIEIDTNILPGDPLYNTYKWGATSWAADGTLTGGVAQANFADVITASALADKIFGLGGNDALDGGAGNDEIDGGIGDDLIGGGTGSDNIKGGDGNDSIIASGGDDRVQGGLGDDKIDGMGGNDVLEGNEGKDNIQGDGIIKAGFMNTLATQYHGADFLDGGAGDDTLTGGGGNDVVYRGADYLDGEDGNDYMEGEGKDDTLYGGVGNDNMWGDTSADNVDTPVANALIWGNDHLKDATNSVATQIRYSCVTGRFDCKVKRLKTLSQRFHGHLERSNTKTPHARSIRLAEPKWLGRRMNAAWAVSDFDKQGARHA